MRLRLSYSNVVSTLALILVLGGGAAVAAGVLEKGSVKSRHIAKNAVKGQHVGPDKLSGADIRESSLKGFAKPSVGRVIIGAGESEALGSFGGVAYEFSCISTSDAKVTGDPQVEIFRSRTLFFGDPITAGERELSQDSSIAEGGTGDFSLDFEIDSSAGDSGMSFTFPYSSAKPPMRFEWFVRGEGSGCVLHYVATRLA